MIMKRVVFVIRKVVMDRKYILFDLDGTLTDPMQGITKSVRYALRPLIISLLRLVIFVFPIAYLFTRSSNVTSLVWWTFPIAEVSYLAIYFKGFLSS